MSPSSVILRQYSYVTGFGTARQTLDGLFDGRTAIHDGPCHGVDTGYASFPDAALYDPAVCAERLALSAGFDAEKAAGCLFIFCAAKADLRGLEAFAANPDTAPTRPVLLADQASAVRDALGIAPGRMLAISNACASGLVALDTAMEHLDAGLCSTAVLFGFDAVSRFIATGFHSLGALSPSRAKPFDAGRDGLTLGDGAALAVLCAGTPAPGDLVCAGAGGSNDANHRTGPSRTGDGLYQAAAWALENAGMTPARIGAVKCHGTATAYNDAMEAKALARLFGAAMPPCVSFKGAIGHTSGAGSLVELLIAADCLKRRMAPPTAGYRAHGVEEPVPLTRERTAIDKPAVLCLSAGFGGVNAAAVVREEER